MAKQAWFIAKVVLLGVAAVLLLGVSIVSNGQWQPIREHRDQIKATRVALIRSVGDLRGRPDASEAPYFAGVYAAKDQPDYAEGDRLTRTFSVALKRLTPLVEADYYQRVVEGYVMQPMVSRNAATLDREGVLAESWEISEDGLTIAFNLREGVIFSNGEPFTSADVLYTFDLIRNPELNAPALRSYFEMVTSWEAEGPYRVVFSLSEPYFLAFSMISGTPILPESYYGEFSVEEINRTAGLLVGSGPYRLEGDPAKWKAGEGQVRLVRNEYYWGPLPAFDELSWLIMTDEVARQTAFKNGEIDAYGVPPILYEALREDESMQDRGDLHMIDDISSGYGYIGWNQQRGGEATVFADRRVRQAMAMLVDREEILADIMAGLGNVASGPFHPESRQANPDVSPWPYDPDAAKALLTEAGFSDIDGDGVLEGPDGQDFRFTLTYGSGNPTSSARVLYVSDALKKAGIIMELEALEWTVLVQRLQSQDFDAITLGWGGSIESDPRQIFHSGSIGGGGNNFGSYRNAELDALIDKARMTVDDQDRLVMWHRVHAILHEDQPYMFLFNGRSAAFIDRRIRGVEPALLGFNAVEEWYVPAGEQKQYD